MRLDYILYTVGIICFIITVGVAYMAAEQQLWIVIPIVLGFAFLGIGVTQRPKQEASTQMAVAPPPPPLTIARTEPTNVKQEIKVEEKKIEPSPVIEIKPATHELLEVKGIKDKRAQQLKAVGINTVEDLAKASATDLAAKLKIAPYFTGKWIENAKQIVEKS
jgi:predicted flap endonuclease-1-like 5' DNA nuclease